MFGVLFALLLTSSPAPAECFVQTGKYVLAEPAIVLVFSGRVAEINRTADASYRATFEVDRVWKGSVPRRFDVYVWELAAEMPEFKKDQAYVVLAKPLTDPPVRQAVGLGETDRGAFTPTTCSGVLSPDIKRELGPGHRPKR